MESVIPISKLNKAVEELNPVIEKAIDADELISQLSKYPEWEALRGRLEDRIESLKNDAMVTKATIGLVDDVEMFGFKRMLSDLIVEELEGIIYDVDGVAKLLKDKKDGEESQ